MRVWLVIFLTEAGSSLASPSPPWLSRDLRAQSSPRGARGAPSPTSPRFRFKPAKPRAGESPSSLVEWEREYACVWVWARAGRRSTPLSETTLALEGSALGGEELASLGVETFHGIDAQTISSHFSTVEKFDRIIFMNPHGHFVGDGTVGEHGFKCVT